MGVTAFVCFVVATAATLVAVALALRARESRLRVTVAAACAVLALLSTATLFIPHSNSEGVRCVIIPATNVLGRDGTDARIAEEPGNWDRTSWSLCIGEARKRSLAAGVVLLGSVTVALATVRRPKGGRPCR